MLPEEQHKLDEATKILEQFEISIDELAKICETFRGAMKMGLNPDECEKSSVKMFPSFVSKVPSGNEKGQFLALDLGGTNYRIILVTLSGCGGNADVTDRTYAIPDEMMNGTAKDLFGYLTYTLIDFLESAGLKETELELGFTFSFPCKQVGLNKATLVRWTKGFSVAGVEGEDVCALLQAALDEKGCKVRCIAVVNDTVGTLASCALDEPRAAVGLIIGTGTNAAYIEQVKNIKTVSSVPDEHMVINTEWGAFGEKGELDSYLTSFDKKLDVESLHPGKQIFEKMTSGMYLGEIVRNILLEMINKGLIFHGVVPEPLKQKNGFRTKFISDPERDPDDLYYGTHYMITTDLGVKLVDPVDPKVVRMVCQAVVKRAAYLIATGLAALLRQMKRPMVVIGVDGSLYRFHPKFHTLMTSMVDKLRPKTTMFLLRLSADGSGRGAAAIAAAHSSKKV